MKAFKIYNVGNQEVIVTYSTDSFYPSFLYSGFTSEEEARQAVIDTRANRKPISNDIEAYQAYCEAEEYVNSGTWTEVLSQGEYKITH